ncbi:hypothetical protein JTY60_01375 [symbiont of Argiope bruennichi]|uniref:hypothetical protein n=1 Tax=symbiont of Argiope bruennichi TaxID=2810479 RepID=UPI003DA23E41
MKVSRNILAKFCPEIRNISKEKLIDCLLNLGYEVESAFDFLALNQKLYTGKILKISKLKGYDKLNLLEVDLSFKKINIVTSYQKLKIEDIVVCVLGSGQTNNKIIKNQQFKEVLSEGMLCSFKEIGLENFLSDVIVLSNYFSSNTIKIGDSNPLKYLELDDIIFDLQFPSICNYNKGIYFIALEIAAFFDLEFNFFKTRNYFVHQNKQVPDLKITCKTEYLKYFNLVQFSLKKVKNDDIFLTLNLVKSDFEVSNFLNNLAKYTMLITGISTNIFALSEISDFLIIDEIKKETPLKISNKEIIFKNVPAIFSNQKIISLGGISKVNENEAQFLQNNTFYFETSLWNDKLFCKNFSQNNFTNFELLINLKEISPLKLPFALNYFVFLLEHYFDDFLIFKKKTINKLTSIAPNSIKVNIKKLEYFVSFKIDLNLLKKKFEKLGYKIRFDNHNIYVQQPRYRTEKFYFNSFAKDIIRFFPFNKVKEVAKVSVNKISNDYEFFSKLNIKYFLLNENFFEDFSYSLVSKNYLNFPSIYKFFEVKNFNSSSFQYYRNNIYSSLFYKNLPQIKSQSECKLFENGFLFSSLKKFRDIFSFVVSKSIQENFDFFSYFQKILEKFFTNQHVCFSKIKFVYVNKKNNFLNFYWKIYFESRLIGLFGVFSQIFLQKNNIKNKEIWFLEIDYFFTNKKLLKTYQFKNNFPISSFDMTKSLLKSEDTFALFLQIKEKIKTYFLKENIYFIQLIPLDVFEKNEFKNFSFKILFQPIKENFSSNRLKTIEKTIESILNER